MNLFEKFTQYLTRLLMWLAACVLGAMIILTCANIFLRIIWTPVKGTFELMGYSGAVTMAFALGLTQLKKGHIAVDVLVLKFSKPVQKALMGINYFICSVFFTIVSYKIAQYATTLLKTGEVTETLRIIYYPFTYCVAFGCATLALVFLMELLKTIFIKWEDKD
jgi:TRAP-type C4-dicarboxylate transport system permease small subunit